MGSFCLTYVSKCKLLIKFSGNILSQTAIVNSDVGLAQYLNDHRIEFSRIEQLSEHTMMIVYR